MRQKLLILLPTLLLLAGCGALRPVGSGVCDCRQAVQVPDKAFRNFLIDKGYAEKAGWHRLKPTAEGCALTALECYSQNIRSLEGIEMFPQLEQVTCSDNPLTELNLNALPRLQRLYCLNVPLRRLEMDSCHHLQRVQLSYTHLKTLNLAPFPELELLLTIFSPLTEIDLSPCANLKHLYIRGTQIHEVDIRPCGKLLELHALDTPLEHIIVTPEQYQSNTKVSVEDTARIITK